MGDSSLLSMILVLFLIAFGMIALSLSPDAGSFDIRWVSASALLGILVCAVYTATWCWGIDRSLRLLNRLLADRDELLRPELKGAMELLRQRLREIWPWGMPK